jgi:hypothetical protein
MTPVKVNRLCLLEKIAQRVRNYLQLNFHQGWLDTYGTSSRNLRLQTFYIIKLIIKHKIISPERSKGIYISTHYVRMSARLIIKSMLIGCINRSLRT